MSPQFWLAQYLRKILICNQQKEKKRKKISIEHKYPSVLHVSPNVEDGSPIHCINLEPTNKNPHKSIKGLQIQSIAQVALNCILFGKFSFTLPILVLN